MTEGENPVKYLAEKNEQTLMAMIRGMRTTDRIEGWLIAIDRYTNRQAIPRSVPQALKQQQQALQAQNTSTDAEGSKPDNAIDTDTGSTDESPDPLPDQDQPEADQSESTSAWRPIPDTVPESTEVHPKSQLESTEGLIITDRPDHVEVILPTDRTTREPYVKAVHTGDSPDSREATLLTPTEVLDEIPNVERVEISGRNLRIPPEAALAPN